MREVNALIDKVARTDGSVLITGESGTGKEIVARMIYELSPRKDRAFVAVDCSALAEPLLESELFGHVKAPLRELMRRSGGSSSWPTGYVFPRRDREPLARHTGEAGFG